MNSAALPSPNVALPIAEVVFNIASGQGYDFLLPPELRGQVAPGCRVTALFHHKPQAGYVIRLKASAPWPNLQPVLALEDKSRWVPPQLMALADWLCKYYCAPHECVVWNLLPSVVRKGQMQHAAINYIEMTSLCNDLGSDAFKALTEKRQEVIRTLLRLGGSMAEKEFLGAIAAGQSVVNALVEAGWLRKVRRVQQRDPFAHAAFQRDEAKELTAEQAAALKTICAAVDDPAPKPILLFGVTGSGKTEVYLQAIDHCLKQGRDAIVLVPEIALTPQTAGRFRMRFGDMVSILHSGLTDGQRFDEWMKINAGQSRIAIGARSALFAPFRKLGLIVVDEEHEPTYKQDEMPHYNARDVAVVRGSLEHCAVVLGSATPSMESYRNCETGKYTLVRMKERVDSRPLPSVEIVDMRLESAANKDSGKAGFFSSRLTELINDRLAKGEQVMLFLNRRGFASRLTCSKCGYTAACDNCSVTYTYHRKTGKLLCHLCGAMLDAPQECPCCGNPDIRYGGFGTERIETVVRAAFPKALVARMDSDTMTNAASYEQILHAFSNQHLNILIGTQMIAKGLDFPNVTLVGIIQADIGLSVPDFRSAERTFNLITQVAGRAGRGEKPGVVVVQTYTPDNYALRAAQNHDYEQFYKMELPGRQSLMFPPFAHLVLLEFKSKDETAAAGTAQALFDRLQPLLGEEIQVIGPMPAPLAKVATFYRYHIILRHADVRRMVALFRQARAALRESDRRNCQIDIDVDPRFMQ